jgi:hypothetical protein
MARKSVNTPLLPPTPDFSNPDEVRQHIALLNQVIQNFSNRLDTIQQVGAVAPSAPLNVVAEGKQGYIGLTWNRIVNVDGYTVIWALDSKMSQLVGRISLPDGETCSYRLPTGNSATTYYFQVSAYKGNQISLPSVTVTATSVAYTTTGTPAANPPQAPRAPQVVGIRNGTTLD